MSITLGGRPSGAPSRHSIASFGRKMSLATSLLLLAGLSLAIALRFSLRDFQSNDFVAFTGPWFDYIRTHGGFRALKDGFSDYNPAYLYLLTAATYLFPDAASGIGVVGALPGAVTRTGVFSGVDAVFAIKLIAIPFDFLNAFIVFRIGRVRYPAGAAPAFAALAALFLPTVVLNSSLWGQADAVYTSGLLGCLYFLLIGRGPFAVAAFALALAVKLQAVFLGPLLLILLFKRAVRWWHFLLIPLVYIATLVPAALVGRPVGDLLTIYARQADSYQLLTALAPTVYQWLPADPHRIAYPLGLLALAIFVLALVAVVSRSRLPLTPEALVALAALCVLAVPFLMPRMHERYFYPADLFALVLAFFVPRLFGVAIAVGLVSLLSYFPSLFEFEVLPLPWLALALLAAIVTIGWHLASTTWGEVRRASFGRWIRPVEICASLVLVAMLCVPLAVRAPAVVAAQSPPKPMTAEEMLSIPNRVDIAFGNSLALVGYSPARPVTDPDGRLRVELYWRRNGWASDQLTTSLQLLDGHGGKLAQDDRRLVPSPWAVSGVVRDPRVVDVESADENSPFVGQIVVAVQGPGGRPISAIDRHDRAAGDSIAVGQFKSPPPDRTAETVATGGCAGAGASLGGKIALSDCPLSGRRLHGGDTLTGQIVWSVIEPLDVDYTAFVQLVGPSGLVAQYDARPRAGGYPTTWWDPGETVRDNFAMRIADATPPGEYQLIAGFYDVRDGRRLGRDGSDHLDLGRVTVE